MRRLINNTRESYRFPFAGVLPPDATQETVFDRVAAPVLAAALDGFNCTVFAFGQTGSGKTFTINGGTERYGDRGLVPRAISAAFAEAAQRSGHAVTFRVSYMEARAAWAAGLPLVWRAVQAVQGTGAAHVAGSQPRLATAQRHCLAPRLPSPLPFPLLPPHSRSTTKPGTTCWSRHGR